MPRHVLGGWGQRALYAGDHISSSTRAFTGRQSFRPSRQQESWPRVATGVSAVAPELYVLRQRLDPAND